MKLYSAADMETQLSRQLLTQSMANGFLTDAQYQQLEQELPSELRTTNLFLRMALFVFTILCVFAAGALFLVVFRPTHQAVSITLLLFAGVCYGAAEFAVSTPRFYRHGIEEALTISSIAYLCAAVEAAFGSSAANLHNPVSLIAAAGAAFSLWIWHRFDLWYAFLLTLIFLVFLPANWTSSLSAHRLIVAAFYAAGLCCLAAIRSGSRFDPLSAHDAAYSPAEALLWIGLYCDFNLRLLGLDSPAQRIFGNTQAPPAFGQTFYWSTWLIIWGLPPLILARAIRRKDRFILTAGVAASLLTLATNKPYLGWPRHTWDPMLLGILLIAAALYLRRWLEQRPGGVRHGFTAARLSKRDAHWVQTGASALGFLSPQSLTPGPQPASPDLGLDGGASGGAGATRDF